MNKIKKFSVIVLSIIMLVSAVPFSAMAKTSAPSKPTSLSATSTTSTVTLKWKKVSKAKGYVVYKYNSKTKKYSKLKTLSKTSYKISKLSSATTYVYAVKAYKTVKKKKYYSKYSSKLTVSTLPDKVNGIKISAKNNSADISWTKVKNATSYKLQYSQDKSFKSGVKSLSVKTNKATVSSLSANKTYYFRIYAIRTVSKKNYTSAASTVVSVKTADTSKLSSVSESTKYQTMEGFGASAAWWAQKIGSWENTEDIIKYLYDEEEGIGLDIYRYNVGAGTRDDENLAYWRRTDSFVDEYDAQTKTFTYDWSRDAEAMNCLEIAKEYAGDDLKVCLFNNSPPVKITANGKSYSYYNGSAASFSTWSTNLQIDNFPAYVTFVTDVADHFVDEGYNVFEVSPINEPQYTWAQEDGGYVSHEGCHYTPIQCKMFYKQMVNAAKDKPYKISMFEAGAAEGPGTSSSQTRFAQYLTNIMSEKVNADYFDTVSAHSYWRSRSTKVQCRNYLDTKFNGLNVACTEYCQMANDSCNGIIDILKNLEGFDRNGMTIDFGVQMARIINDDLTALNATQWNWWTACADGYYPDGLVYINEENHSDIQIPKRLWCLGNYSRFIEPGAVRVKITEAQKDVISCAFKNKDGSLVIVYVNQTGNDKAVNIDASGYKEYEVFTTSADADLEETAKGTYSITNNISLPSQSVVSVVLTK